MKNLAAFAIALSVFASAAAHATVAPPSAFTGMDIYFTDCGRDCRGLDPLPPGYCSANPEDTAAC